ncbi:DUF3128 domain-containing protein [Microdochium nivale]|nr:DUF3128 domain-containing protein [Microdochium nivale]
MGWLWSSGSDPVAPFSSPSAAQDPTPDAISPRASSKPVSKPAEDDGHDPELAKFFAQLQAEFGSNNSNKASTQQTPTTTAEQIKSDQSSSLASDTATAAPSKPSSWKIWGSSSSNTAEQGTAQPFTSSQPTTATAAPPSQQDQQQLAVPARLDPISESLLPTTMSCRQAFDTAFHCNSLGGQWTSVYRAGTVRSCSEHWDNFWFCMRARAYTGEVKDEAIRDYYRQRELVKYYGQDKPNSTEVWEARTEKVEPGTAFRKPYVQPEMSDEEWWRMEIEHRRKVQEELQRGGAAAAASSGR